MGSQFKSTRGTGLRWSFVARFRFGEGLHSRAVNLQVCDLRVHFSSAYSLPLAQVPCRRFLARIRK